MHMKQHEHGPPVREYPALRQHEILVNRERYVFQHHQYIRRRESRQDAIYGRHLGVLPREDDDVEHVGEGAEGAHHQSGVTVIIFVLRRQIANRTVAITRAGELYRFDSGASVPVAASSPGDLIAAVAAAESVAIGQVVEAEIAHVVNVLVGDVELTKNIRVVPQTMHDRFTTQSLVLARVSGNCESRALTGRRYCAS